jgi:protein-tyrosine phosphatase
MDTLRGLHKAREFNFFDFENFNLEEYEYYEQVENGDLNWCVEGKFIAFAGPHATRETSPAGYQSLCPDDYIPYFLRKNVTMVVRLNKKYYDAKRFINHGINHVDLYFVDGSNPPDHILNKFLQLSEETPGSVAVHCKAGLGRTGSLIGCYIMKHYKFTAEEVIGWLRIVRPGSVIGPQQQYMKDVQARMWREGQMYRERFATLKATSGRNGSNGSLGALAASSSSKFSNASVNDLDNDEEKERAGDSQGDHLRQRRQQMKDDMNGTKHVSSAGAGVAMPSLDASRDRAGSGASAPGGRNYMGIGGLLSSWK